MTTIDFIHPAINVSDPHPYRIWHACATLDQRDAFPIDREVADLLREAVFTTPRETIAVRARACLALAETGYRTFFELRTGIPHADDTHRVLDRHDIAAHTFYADHDPFVRTHSMAYREGNYGVTCAEADPTNLRDVFAAASREGVRLDRPIAAWLGMADLMIGDSLAHYLEGFAKIAPPGSAIGFVLTDPDQATAVNRWNTWVKKHPIEARTHPEVLRILKDAGLTPMAPGVVRAENWRNTGWGIDRQPWAVVAQAA